METYENVTLSHARFGENSENGVFLERCRHRPSCFLYFSMSGRFCGVVCKKAKVVVWNNCKTFDARGGSSGGMGGGGAGGEEVRVPETRSSPLNF